MKAIYKLCAMKVAHLSKPGRYGDGRGLYLQVTKSLTKSWLFRYQRDGVEHFMGLGSVRSLGLADAREEARKAQRMLHLGIDPLRAKRNTEVEKAASDPKRNFEARHERVDSVDPAQPHAEWGGLD